MYGIGAVELLILIAVAVVLFGAPVLTFIMGYSMGKKSTEPQQTASDSDSPEPGPSAEE